MIKTLASLAITGMAAGAALAAYCPMPSNFYCPSTAIACTNDTATGKPYDSCCVATDGLLVYAMNWTMGQIQNPNRTNWFDLSKVYAQPKDEWTIHGLWPDHCDGTYSNDERGCDYPNRYYTDVEQRITAVAPPSLLADMRKYWPGGDGDYNWFWSHEFTKHGTCFSVIDPACYGPKFKKDQDVLDYFRIAMAIREKYPLYEIFAKAGIVPSSSATYTRAEFYAALKAGTGFEGGLQCVRDLRADDPNVKYFVAEIFLYLINKPGLILDPIDPFKGHYQSCPDNIPLYYIPFPE
ncbi:Ribonuclease T2 precursor (RNase T2) [Dinochytrium kinnereticum]|nr:Ribonuclease T2 precursor (RNase T2) [Dinochytrium kinnereticum]